MPNLSSFVPWEEGTHPEFPCVWCGGLTDIRADTPFRPDLGSLPLHLTCGADLIEVYNMIKAGRSLTTDQQARAVRMVNLPRLEMGDE